MSIGKAEAGEELAAIDEVVRRLRQSRLYRVAGELTILWGVLDIARLAVAWALPASTDRWSWLIVDVFGVALTVARVARIPGRKVATAGRIVAAAALFYGFGIFWSYGVGHFDGRQATVFWHTLFLFGYSLAGLWFGYGFLVLGLGVTAAIFAIYLFAGVWFVPAVALVAGLGYVLCGLWMLRA